MNRRNVALTILRRDDLSKDQKARIISALWNAEHAREPDRATFDAMLEQWNAWGYAHLCAYYPAHIERLLSWYFFLIRRPRRHWSQKAG